MLEKGAPGILWISYSYPHWNMRPGFHWYGKCVNILAFYRLPKPWVHLKHQIFMRLPAWVAVNRLVGSWVGRIAHILWAHGAVLHYLTLSHTEMIQVRCEELVYRIYFWKLWNHILSFVIFVLIKRYLKIRYVYYPASTNGCHLVKYCVKYDHLLNLNSVYLTNNTDSFDFCIYSLERFFHCMRLHASSLFYTAAVLIYS